MLSMRLLSAQKLENPTPHVYDDGTLHVVAALSEESSTKPADRAELSGYLKKWLNAKYLWGCAFIVSLLPCSVFSRTMIDIVRAINV